MMKKAEMKQHFRRYGLLVNQAREARKRGDITYTVELAVASWEYIDGMLRHLSQQVPRKDANLDGIVLVLRYAPLLFDHELLGRLGQFLKATRRIAKWSSSNFNDDLSHARNLMWQVHALWDQLERHGYCEARLLRQCFTGVPPEWTQTIETWEAMGVVRRITVDRVEWLTLATRMDDLSVGKCPNCGNLARRTKTELLEPVRCNKCRRAGHFVQIAEAHTFGA